MLSQNTYDDGNSHYKNVRALETEKMFRRISTNAKSKGLLVNAKKTNLLVVSASRSYEARAHIYDENNNRIDSTDPLKTLGFYSTTGRYQFSSRKAMYQVQTKSLGNTPLEKIRFHRR